MTVRFSRRRRCKYNAIFHWLSYERSYGNHTGQSEQRRTPQSSNEKKRQRENKQTDSRAGNLSDQDTKPFGCAPDWRSYEFSRAITGRSQVKIMKSCGSSEKYRFLTNIEPSFSKSRWTLCSLFNTTIINLCFAWGYLSGETKDDANSCRQCYEICLGFFRRLATVEAEMCKYKSKYFLVLREFQKPRKGEVLVYLLGNTMTAFRRNVLVNLSMSSFWGRSKFVQNLSFDLHNVNTLKVCTQNPWCYHWLA